MIDLSPIATGAFAFPTYSNSIKYIATWLGFSWRHDDVDATSAIDMYTKYSGDQEADVRACSWFCTTTRTMHPGAPPSKSERRPATQALRRGSGEADLDPT